MPPLILKSLCRQYKLGEYHSINVSMSVFSRQTLQADRSLSLANCTQAAPSCALGAAQTHEGAEEADGKHKGEEDGAEEEDAELDEEEDLREEHEEGRPERCCSSRQHRHSHQLQSVPSALQAIGVRRVVVSLRKVHHIIHSQTDDEGHVDGFQDLGERDRGHVDGFQDLRERDKGHVDGFQDLKKRDKRHVDGFQNFG